MYEYEVNGKLYRQKPLVLGQIKQLIVFLGNLAFPAIESAEAEIGMIIGILGDRLPHALAIVLTEDGIPLKEKNLENMAAEIESTFDIAITMRIVEDFFDCNPIASLFDRVTLGMQKLADTLKGTRISRAPALKGTTGLMKSASALAPEISQNGM